MNYHCCIDSLEQYFFAQSAGAVEYTNCTSDDIKHFDGEVPVMREL